MGFAPGIVSIIGAQAGAAGTVASGVVGALAARQQAEAQAAQRKYQATLQERQAEAEAIRGKENRRRLRDDRRQYLASVRVRQANSGLVSDVGSPLAVLGEITSRADERIYDFTEDMAQRVSLLRDQARITRWNARQIQEGAKWEMAGNLLQTGVKAAGSYRRGKRFFG